MDNSVTTKRLDAGKVLLYGQNQERVQDEANTLVALDYTIIETGSKPGKVTGQPYFFAIAKK